MKKARAFKDRGNAALVSWALAALAALATLGSGCWSDPPCETSGYLVSDVKVEPAKACLNIEIEPQPDPMCITERFAIQNDCSEELTLDLAGVPFSPVSGAARVSPSGGRTTFKIDFLKVGSASSGEFKSPGTLGTESVQLTVRISDQAS